jgi:hypothetical protein
LGSYVHSVFGITGASGKRYIVDFTIEQFGYDAEKHWFLSESAYLTRCTMDGVTLPVSRAHCKEGEGKDPKRQAFIGKFAGALDWDGVLAKGRVERLRIIRRSARVYFEGS